MSQAEIIQAIVDNDIEFFKSYANLPQLGEETYYGRTYLDFALLNHHDELAALFRSAYFKQTLQPSDEEKIRRMARPGVDVYYDYKVSVTTGSDQALYCDIALDGGNNISIDSQQLDENVQNKGVIAKQTPEGMKVILLASSDKLLANIVLDITAEKIVAQATGQIFGRFDLTAKSHAVSLEGQWQPKHLSITADNCTFTDKSMLKVLGAHVQSKNNLTLAGTLIGQKLQMRAPCFEHVGQTTATDSFRIDGQGNVQIAGQLCAKSNSEIIANKIYIARETMVMVDRGVLTLFGEAAIKNAGVLRAPNLNLESLWLVANLQGGLIQSQNCHIPRHTAVFSNAGFYLVGYATQMGLGEVSLMLGDFALTCARLFSILPQQQFHQLRQGLRLARAIYHGANIISQVSAGGMHTVEQTTWVNYCLNHLIPVVGIVSNRNEQAHIFIRMMYALWGWQYSQKQFFIKSIGLLEMVIRSAKLLGHNMLTVETQATLSSLANHLHVTALSCFAIQSVDDIVTLTTGNQVAATRAGERILAATEAMVRHHLQQIEPIAIHRYTISPAALAAYVMDEGYTMSPLVQVDRCAQAGLYLLNQSNMLTPDARRDWQYAVRFLMSGTYTVNALKAYRAGRVDRKGLTTQIISLLTVLASYSAARRAQRMLLSPEVVEAVPENTDGVPEAAVTTSADLTTDIAAVTSDPSTAESVLAEDTSVIASASSQTTDGKTSISNDEAIVSEASVLAPVIASSAVVDHLAPTSYLDEAVAQTSDAETLPDPEIIKAAVAENAQQVHVVTERPNIQVTLPEFVPPPLQPPAHISPTMSWDNIQATCQDMWVNGVKQPYADLAGFVHQTLLGQGVASDSGYLGVAPESQINTGAIEVSGQADCSVWAGQNAGSMRAKNAVNLLGRVLTDNNQTAFINNGLLEADSVNIYDVGDVGLDGTTRGASYRMRGVKRHRQSGVCTFTQEIQVDGQEMSLNEGIMIAPKITHHGSKQSINAGTLAGQIVKQSGDQILETETGHVQAQQLILDGRVVDKSGSIQAQYVTVENSATGTPPDSVYWGSNKNDQIGYLKLDPKYTLHYEPDAFNGVQITSLTLPEAPAENTPIVNLAPDFDQTLQVSLPVTEQTLTPADLPAIDPKATLIVDAPDQNFSITNETIPHTFFFKGRAFKNNGESTIKQLGLDVVSVDQFDGHASLTLQGDSFIRANTFTNRGQIENPEHTITFDVNQWSNQPDVYYVDKAYIQSKRAAKEPQIVTDRRFVENSGSVYAKGFRGYIGEFQQAGGKFNSGVDGTQVFIENGGHVGGKFEIISSYVNGKTGDEVIQHKGKSFWNEPVAHNAEIISEGPVILQGDGKFKVTGVTIEGKGGTQVFFNQGVDATEVEQEQYHKSLAQNKKGKCTIPEETGYISTQNHIADTDGPVMIAASSGALEFGDTTLVSAKDMTLVAATDITFEGRPFEAQSKEINRRRTWKGHRVQEQDNDYVEIRAGALLTGGDLNVSCLTFTGRAVQHHIAGDTHQVVLDTAFSEGDAWFNNQTKTKSITINLPTDNLVGLLKNDHSKAIFQTLTQHLGWDGAYLDNLLATTEAADLPANLVAAAKHVWDVTALVAETVNTLTEEGATGAAGIITDNLGLTNRDSQGQRRVNTKIGLTVTRTTETTEMSKSVVSNVNVGGNYHLYGRRLEVSGGTQVSADRLVLALKEGIEMAASEDRLRQRASRTSAHVAVNVFNPEEVDVSYSKDTVRHDEVERSLATLTGRSEANIHAGKIVGQGVITAPTGTIIAPEINLTSAYSSYHHEDKAFAVSASTDANNAAQNPQGVGSAQYRRNVEKAASLHKAGIIVPDGTVKTNYVDLNQGAWLDVQTLVREDDQAGLPTVNGSTGEAYHIRKNIAVGGSLSFDQSNGAIQNDFVYDESRTIHQPTVLAANVGASDLPGINTERDKISETYHRRHGRMQSFDTQQPARFEHQKAAVKQATQTLARGAQKGLHFMFKPNKSGSEPDIAQRTLSEDTLFELPEVLPPVSAVEPEEQSTNVTSTIDTSNPAVIAPADVTVPDTAKEPELHPIFAALPQTPDVQAHLKQLTPEEKQLLIQMVEDDRAGRPNAQLEALRKTYNKPKASKWDAFINLVNPVRNAQANPLVLAPLAMMAWHLGLLVVIDRMNRRPIDIYFEPSDEDLFQQAPLGFPINSQSPVIYDGDTPENNSDDGVPLPFPVHEHPITIRLDHPPHEDNATPSYEFPLLLLNPVYYSLYKQSQTTEYKANPKHQKTGDKISRDIFYKDKYRDAAEALLNESIDKKYHAKDSKQYYAPIRDVNDYLHVFVFQPTHNDGREYHGYLFEYSKEEKNVDNKIKTLSKKWHDEGVISKVEYKKVINGKMKWDKKYKKEFKIPSNKNKV